MNVKFVPAHIDAVGALILILGEEVEFTVIPILLETPTLLTAQIFVLEITQVIVSRWLIAEEANVVLLVPTFEPFTFHWNVGLTPPLEGVAVNVTLAPAQMFELDAEMETEGLALLFTVILIAFEPAFVVAAQGLITLILQVTTSPLFRVLEEYVVLFVPTFDPLIFH